MYRRIGRIWETTRQVELVIEALRLCGNIGGKSATVTENGQSAMEILDQYSDRGTYVSLESEAVKIGEGGELCTSGFTMFKCALSPRNRGCSRECTAGGSPRRSDHRSWRAGVKTVCPFVRNGDRRFKMSKKGFRCSRADASKYTLFIRLCSQIDI